MNRLLFRWVINAIGLFAITFLPGIARPSFGTLFVAAAVLGLLNALVRPILFWLTLPVTILTLGLFLLVLNGVMLKLTAWLVDGFVIHGFIPAVVGALVLSVISLATGWVGKER